MIRNPVQVIGVSGGKGGVGKSNVSVNLAVALAERDHRVLLLDADLGLANLDVLLGIKPRQTLDDVLNGRCTLDEVLVDGPAGVKVVPASSGIARMTKLSAALAVIAARRRACPGRAPKRAAIIRMAGFRRPRSSA